VPMDKLAGTFHDGTRVATKEMRACMTMSRENRA
jgi:hypothetical protein